jgi:L-fuconolactonase
LGLKHFQLENAIELVRSCPNVSFVLDHIGKPDISQTAFSQSWNTQINQLAALPNNVYCKLSGMVTEAKKSWKTEDLDPYASSVLKAFGADRIMYGSDWPVVELASEYKRWFEASRSVTKHFPLDSLEKLYKHNALKFYKIE